MIALTPAVGEGNEGPCNNDYNSGGIIDLDDAGIVFGTDVNGCITWEAFETFDDDDEATPDQTFGDGTITLWGCPPGAILPVHLVSFEVKPQGYSNVIHWSTAIEINSQEMILEKSSNLQSWIEVGRVNSRGSSHSGAIYSMEDRSPFSLSYYRLRMIDFDGSFVYSHIISIQREVSTFRVNKIGPNPTIDNLIISLESADQQEVVIELYDVSGKLVLSQTSQIESGFTSVNLDLQELNEGLYICQLRAGSYLSSHQIIKGK